MVARVTETFAVALVGETDAGWLVDASSAEEAVTIVHGTVPRAHEVWRSELLAWNGTYYRQRYLGGGPFPDSWARLTPPTPCPACGKGYFVDPAGTAAGTRCMVETAAVADGLVLETGCGYRPADAAGHRLD